MTNLIDRKIFSIRIGSLVFFIFLVNCIALRFHWYSSIWWFDMLMHFMGGFWLGLVFILLFWNKIFDFNLILKIILGVLFIGLGWEFFEITVNHFTIKEYFNVLDTISDICFDIAGGIFAILYFFKNYINKI
ncbi:MAG: hypothetical protein WCX46_00245 [Candidatus Paceibacterota bacterium]